jgi:dTDP-4-amino-4,6-dideoxygalactose transaminase
VPARGNDSPTAGSEPGFKYNMTDVQAALGVVQLPKLDGWIERRRELWERYDELLAGLPLETPPHAQPHTRHARHLYQVRLTGEAPMGRDELIQSLHDRNIGTFISTRTTATRTRCHPVRSRSRPGCRSEPSVFHWDLH